LKEISLTAFAEAKTTRIVNNDLVAKQQAMRQKKSMKSIGKARVLNVEEIQAKIDARKQREAEVKAKKERREELKAISEFVKIV